MGMNARPKFTGLIDRRIADGTRNLAKEPAMTREQAEAAVLAGIGLAEDMKARGYDIVCTGEMGIGNTTTAAAVCAALLDLDPEDVAGRGSGLTDDALARKKRVIRSALALHRPDRRDVIGVLSKVGGFDIAGMAGIFIGGARCGLPVVIDGFISSVAALAAARLCPGCAGAMLASHVSGEPAGPLALRKLQLSPLITAGMRLGEGTGAVAALPLLDLALRVYHGSASFDELGMDAYEKL
jgi:nicotinate-nucleotide--dimethylbenzimidazole phosphoribosyltransferase